MGQNLSKPRSSSPPETLCLSNAERDYLRDGITGSYTEAQLQDRIKQKISRVPDRIERLQTDLQLLSENDMISRETWEEEFHQLLGFEQTPSSSQLDSCLKAKVSSDEASLSSKPIDLGLEFGKMVDNLWFPPKQYQSESRKQLIYGFLKGVYISPRSMRQSFRIPRRMFVDDIKMSLEHFSDIEDKKRQPMLKNLREFSQDIGDPEQDLNLVRERIAKVLVNEGKISEQDFKDLREYHESISFGETPKPNLVDYIMEDIFEEVDFFSSNKDKKLDVDKQMVIDAANKKELIEHCKLENILYKYQKKVENKCYKNISAESVLRCIYEKKEATSREINTEMNVKKDRRKGISTLCRDLQGDKRYKREVLVDPSVLRKTSQGWTLTSFGELLSFYMFDYIPFGGFRSIDDEILKPGFSAIEST